MCRVIMRTEGDGSGSDINRVLASCGLSRDNLKSVLDERGPADRTREQLMRLFSLTHTIFEDDALAWLRTPNCALSHRTPLAAIIGDRSMVISLHDMLASEWTVGSSIKISERKS